jgi:hypothetical protein
MILVTRRRTHAPTIAYINRPTQEGKTKREAIRCLKRYSPATSTGYSNKDRHWRLDKHRSITGTAEHAVAAQVSLCAVVHLVRQSVPGSQPGRYLTHLDLGSPA